MKNSGFYCWHQLQYIYWYGCVMKEEKAMEAMEVAKYIINLYYEMNQPLSNLKLQKLLYFVQGASLAIFNKPAFEDNIEAWQYGPVVPNVYFPYSLYGPLDIKVQYDNTISDEQIEKVTRFISFYYRNVDPFSLVNETHKDGSPWSNVYHIHKKSIISTKAISSYFKEYYLKEWFE